MEDRPRSPDLGVVPGNGFVHEYPETGSFRDKQVAVFDMQRFGQDLAGKLIESGYDKNTFVLPGDNR